MNELMTDNIEDVWKKYDLKRTDGVWPAAQLDAYLAKLQAQDEAKKKQQQEKDAQKEKKQQKKNP